MGMFDKAKEMAEKATDMVEEHGDKLPGDLGEKAKEMAEKASDLVEEHGDKIPGMGA